MALCILCQTLVVTSYLPAFTLLEHVYSEAGWVEGIEFPCGWTLSSSTIQTMLSILRSVHEENKEALTELHKWYAGETDLPPYLQEIFTRHGQAVADEEGKIYMQLYLIVIHGTTAALSQKNGKQETLRAPDTFESLCRKVSNVPSP